MDELIEFPIHFNVPNHYLRIDDFVSFSKDMKKIILEFNARTFNNSTTVEIFILPPKDGTFLGKWGIKLTLTSISAGSLFMAMDTDISKGFIRGLTTHEPAYYAEMVGSETRKGAILLVDATKGFLEKNANAKELNQIKPTDFPDAYFAKNDFYRKCILNKNISGIGFTCEDEFPIERNLFIQKIAFLPDKNLGPEPEYEIYQLRIVSPVNTDDSKSQWQLQDVQTRRTLRAYLRDDNFRKDFFGGKYPLKSHDTDDIIIAMIEFKKINFEGEERIIERNIIKVYKFNDIVLDKIPEHTTISCVSRARSGVPERQLSFLDSISKD